MTDNEKAQTEAIDTLTAAIDEFVMSQSKHGRYTRALDEPIVQYEPNSFLGTPDELLERGKVMYNHFKTRFPDREYMLRVAFGNGHNPGGVKFAQLQIGQHRLDA